LGHIIAHCRKEFIFLAGLNDFDTDVFEFDALRNALATVDVSSLTSLRHKARRISGSSPSSAKAGTKAAPARRCTAKTSERVGWALTR